MGLTHAKLSSEAIAEIQTKTDNKLSEREIKEWYKGFMNDNPEGWLGPEEFKKIYTNFFPFGDCEDFAMQVFRSFDSDGNNRMDFVEFLTALSITSRGGMESKLSWAFDMYDKDGNGGIDKSEMVEILSAILKMIRPRIQGQVQDEEDDPMELTERIFSEMDADGNGLLSKEEFIEGAKRNPCLLRLMTLTH